VDESRIDSLACDLIRLLTDLREQYAELAMHVGNKLEAMRRADVDRIHAITAREMVLASRGSEREGLRRQIAQRLGEALGIDRERSRTMRVAELAGYLREPLRSQLLGVAAGLRAKLEEVGRVHKVNSLVAQQMLRHLGEVVRAMTSGGEGGELYSVRGRRHTARAANVFEAVG
jgi:hypothetical protein